MAWDEDLVYSTWQASCKDYYDDGIVTDMLEWCGAVEKENHELTAEEQLQFAAQVHEAMIGEIQNFIDTKSFHVTEKETFLAKLPRGCIPYRWVLTWKCDLNAKWVIKALFFKKK